MKYCLGIITCFDVSPRPHNSILQPDIAMSPSKGGRRLEKHRIAPVDSRLHFIETRKQFVVIFQVGVSKAQVGDVLVRRRAYVADVSLHMARQIIVAARTQQPRLLRH